MTAADILKNISGGVASPLNTLQQQGSKVADSAETVTQVAEGYVAIQIIISCAGLAIAYGMLEMYKKTYALQLRRLRKGKRR